MHYLYSVLFEDPRQTLKRRNALSGVRRHTDSARLERNPERCRHGSSTNGLMLHGRRKLVKSNGKQSGYCGSTGNFRTGAGGRARGGGGWGGRGGGGGGGEVYLTAGVKEYQRRKEARAARDKSPILGSACRDILGVSDQRRASRLFEDISPATSPNFRKRLSIQAGSLSQLQGQVAAPGSFYWRFFGERGVRGGEAGGDRHC
ncbi:hypothetical protein RRG08_046966 [Elysia crispata]|uniref:Uncharacterized protein n=1 Tax=Elysia crispata TaxID=231223 RepID=A0AAE1A8W6_9GAST|nr:hypothetical protein RRG08_046966 [Elysia crispata]